MSNLPVATRVKDEIMKVQIPNNCRPGDSFVVTPPDGRVFTVIVPDNAMPGSFIDIVVPSDDAGAPNPNPSSVTLKKSTIGAVLAGGAVGLLFGPIGVVCLAGGALAAVSDKGAIGAVEAWVIRSIINQLKLLIGQRLRYPICPPQPRMNIRKLRTRITAIPAMLPISTMTLPMIRFCILTITVIVTVKISNPVEVCVL